LAVARSHYSARRGKKPLLRTSQLDHSRLLECLELVERYNYGELRDKPIHLMSSEEFEATICYNFYSQQLNRLLRGALFNNG